jgi:hypothetical protein
VVGVIQADDFEGVIAELAHRPGLARTNYEIRRLVLLEHEPHRAHVVTGESPVPPSIQVAERDGLGETQ